MRVYKLFYLGFLRIPAAAFRLTISNTRKLLLILMRSWWILVRSLCTASYATSGSDANRTGVGPATFDVFSGIRDRFYKFGIRDIRIRIRIRWSEDFVLNRAESDGFRNPKYELRFEAINSHNCELKIKSFVYRKLDLFTLIFA